MLTFFKNFYFKHSIFNFFLNPYDRLLPGDFFFIIFKQPTKMKHVRRPLMNFKQFYYIMFNKKTLGVKIFFKRQRYKRLYVWGILLSFYSRFRVIFRVQIFNTPLEFFVNMHSIYFLGFFPVRYRLSFFDFTIKYQLYVLKRFRSKFFKLDVYNNWTKETILKYL